MDCFGCIHSNDADVQILTLEINLDRVAINNSRYFVQGHTLGFEGGNFGEVVRASERSHDGKKEEDCVPKLHGSIIRGSRGIVGGGIGLGATLELTVCG